MDRPEYQEIIAAEVRARRAARNELGVGEGASPREVTRAWRKRCLETHPDRNPGAPDADRKFRLVNCAYRLLTDGTPCEDLLANDIQLAETPRSGKYDLSNDWGYFLWWKEAFF
jgi:hypothetical protein